MLTKQARSAAARCSEAAAARWVKAVGESVVGQQHINDRATMLRCLILDLSPESGRCCRGGRNILRASARTFNKQ